MNDKILDYKWVCPWCGKVMFSGDTACSGSYLEKGHPSNCIPVKEKR
jgi:hypothetical protein